MAKPTRARHPHAILESQTHVDPRSILSPFRIHCKLHGWLCLTVREGMAASGEMHLRNVDLWSAWECPICVDQGVTEPTVTAFDDAWFRNYIDGHHFHRRDSAVQQGLQWGLDSADPEYVYESMAPYLRGGDVPTALALRSGWVLGWVLTNLAKPRRPRASSRQEEQPQSPADWARAALDRATPQREPLHEWAQQWWAAGGWGPPTTRSMDYAEGTLTCIWHDAQSADRSLQMRVRAVTEVPVIEAFLFDEHGNRTQAASTAGLPVTREMLYGYWKWYRC